MSATNHHSELETITQMFISVQVSKAVSIPMNRSNTEVIIYEKQQISTDICCYVWSLIAPTLCYKTPVFLQLMFAVFHTNKIKYANGVVNMPIF